MDGTGLQRITTDRCRRHDLPLDAAGPAHVLPGAGRVAGVAEAVRRALREGWTPTAMGSALHLGRFAHASSKLDVLRETPCSSSCSAR